MHLQEQLIQVREKLQLLLKQHSMALKEIQQLTSENNRLRQQLQERNLHTSQLNEKMDAINISSMVISEESKKELEKKINNYLKEIDTCLALLKT